MSVIGPDWEMVIGLEIHVRLDTDSKLFSGMKASYGASPNSQVSFLDAGLPGTLPVINQKALEYAIRFGLSIDAEIPEVTVFARKNYFYPDLPKGYQISQMDDPIVGKGHLVISTENGEKTIEITRAHLEEDAGKSVHDLFPGQTGIDLNRTGTPLLEIVSEPDFRTAKEASTYFKQLHGLVRYLKICDGNLAQGSMRCDANVSVRPVGQEEFGERTEIKNINSFRFVEQAINVEIERQIDVLEGGGTIERETRLYDPDRNETRSMRSKEFSEDYRYFPDPDLLPLKISQALVDRVRDDMPELPEARRNRYVESLGLSEYDAGWLSSDPDVAAYFDASANTSGNPKSAANWVMGELSAHLNRQDLVITQSPVSPDQLGQIITRIDDETLSSKTAKQLFEALWQQEGGDVDALIESLGLKQMSDTGELEGIIEKILADNPDQVEQLKSGKDKVLGFFVGQVMKATQGKANPKQVNDIIRSKI